jgi:hypothetical protein
MVFISSVRGSRGFLTDQRSRRHLTACHTVNGVIDKYSRYLFTSVSRVHDLSGTDGSEVSVSLISKHYILGMNSFNTGRDGGSSSVSGFLRINVKIFIREYGASDRHYPNCFILYAELVDSFGYKPMYDAVAAARAVMHNFVSQKFCLFKNFRH